MPVIEVKTRINAPRERVFDLARSIDAHMESTAGTGERAVDGRTSGLIEQGETVTWEAKHLGVRQRLKVVITDFERPDHFADEMVFGAFKSMSHTHRFVEISETETEMIDVLDFRAPLGPLGRLAEWLFLTRYMRRFLIERNSVLKELAENGPWEQYLSE